MTERAVLVNSSATKAVLIHFHQEKQALSQSRVAAVPLQKTMMNGVRKRKGE